MRELITQDQFDLLPERHRPRARHMAARAAEIQRVLSPCGLEAIRSAGARLHGQLRPQPDINIEEFAYEFKLACSDLPEWAITAATDDFLAGRVPNHTGQFMPTCAEFARHARFIISEFVSELGGLKFQMKKLLTLAEEEDRRARFELERVRERSRPGHKEWIRGLVKQVTASAPKPIERPRFSSDPEMRARLDALKPKRPEPESKLSQTSIVRGAKR